MPVLVCRECQGDGEVKNRSPHYRNMDLVTVECTKCGNTWYIPVSKSFTEDDLKKLNEYQKYGNQADTQKDEPPQTAMAIAINKALENQKTDKGKRF